MDGQEVITLPFNGLERCGKKAGQIYWRNIDENCIMLDQFNEQTHRPVPRVRTAWVMAAILSHSSTDGQISLGRYDSIPTPSKRTQFASWAENEQNSSWTRLLYFKLKSSTEWFLAGPDTWIKGPQITSCGTAGCKFNQFLPFAVSNKQPWNEKKDKLNWIEFVFHQNYNLIYIFHVFSVFLDILTNWTAKTAGWHLDVSQEMERKCLHYLQASQSQSLD